MKTPVRLALSALLFAHACALVSSAQQTTSTPAAQRAREIIALYNSGDRAAARAYITQNLTPEALGRVPVEDRLNTISRTHDRTRGVELQSIRDTEPAKAFALVREKLTGQTSEVLVEIEPAAPHRIIRFGLRGVPVTATPARRLTDAEIARDLDSLLRKLSDADLFSGAVLVARDGKPLFMKAYGEANKDFQVPNRVDTKFNLGSMNKMFTGVAIAQLAEAGRLSFDDPLAKFLPDFPNKEAAEKIKLKHLLTHTSGLGSYFNERFIESSRERFRTVDDFMELAKNETLAFEPGAKQAYSNTGFLVLGKVIEKVTGQGYFDYVRERIFKPAGMTNTDSYELDRVNPNLAVGYQKSYTDEGIVFRNNIYRHVIRGGPAGGGYSTAEDLWRFATALRSGKLVGAAFIEILLSPKPELNSPDYGYGFSVNTERGIAGHNGGFTGINANLDMFTNSGYTAVVLSNYGDAAEPIASRIEEMILSVTPVSKQ